MLRDKPRITDEVLHRNALIALNEIGEANREQFSAGGGNEAVDGGIENEGEGGEDTGRDACVSALLSLPPSTFGHAW